MRIFPYLYLSSMNIHYLIIYLPEPTICPYGDPVRVCVPNIRANNFHPRKPVITEVFTSAKQIPDDLEMIETKRDDSPDVLKPRDIDSRVSTINILFFCYYKVWIWKK